MKSTNLILRRTHLYLGMLLIPWLLIFGLSTLMFNHVDYFRPLRPADPQFVSLWEKDYTLPRPITDTNLREVVAQLLADNGLQGAFGARQQGNVLDITLQNFLEPTKLKYNLNTKQLRAEKKKFAWVEVLQRLHFRAGYNGSSLLANVWPVIVDVFCVTMLIWILTGLYLWWKIRDSRRWGWITIGGGMLTIALLLVTL